MNYRNFVKQIVVLVVVTTAILGLAGMAPAAEFSADMTEIWPEVRSDANPPVTQKLYVKGHLVRREELNSVGKEICIMNSDKNIIWILTPGNKSYTEQHVGKNEPKTFLEYLKTAKPAFRKAGTEKIAGYMCEKYTSNDIKNKVFRTVYFSPKLGVPLKDDSKRPVKFNSKIVNIRIINVLSNINEVPQDDSYFTIPAGYKKVVSSLAPRKPAAHASKTKAKKLVSHK
ncbi:MAG: DUF4412 domain-containing protein [Armatimonadota bacterium]